MYIYPLSFWGKKKKKKKEHGSKESRNLEETEYT